MWQYGEFLVTPDELRLKADEWEEIVSRAKEALENLEKAALDTKSLWQGKGGERMRILIAGKKEKSEVLFDDFRKLAMRLKLIAEEYEESERENTNVYGRN